MGVQGSFFSQGRGALQDIDQLSLFKTLCKACISVRAVRDIVPTLRKAIATAQSGTPGKKLEGGPPKNTPRTLGQWVSFPATGHPGVVYCGVLGWWCFGVPLFELGGGL